MKNTYPMIQTDTQLLVPPRRLECIIIRNYPTKYSKVIKTFKEYLEGTPHITKYCDVKHEKYIRCSKGAKWLLCNIKPENIFIFPYYYYEDYYWIELIWDIRNKYNILQKYVISPTFYIKSEKNLIEYYSTYGNLLIDESNLQYIYY